MGSTIPVTTSWISSIRPGFSSEGTPINTDEPVSSPNPLAIAWVITTWMTVSTALDGSGAVGMRPATSRRWPASG